MEIESSASALTYRSKLLRRTRKYQSHRNEGQRKSSRSQLHKRGGRKNQILISFDVPKKDERCRRSEARAAEISVLFVLSPSFFDI
mmetsp:Transcript_1377/g.1839  ORF Transcript_1377/g.1839 Transcript_1377/m.1839 type:complete len:86 (+) Transcript_1377:3061-3318(+)